MFNFESANAREVISGKGYYEIKPLTAGTAAATIARLFAPSLRWGKNVGKIEKPERFEKTRSQDVRSIDSWDNACEATLRLLQKDNPELARAKKAGKPNPHCARAFVADVVRRLGIGPAGFSADDREYNRLICEAWQQYDNRTRRKSTAEIVDWHLAHPSNWIRFYCKNPVEISQMVAKETGTDPLSGAAIEKRMERLELVRDCRSGRREQ